MASIVKRGKHFAVVYNYINDQGLKKQKWETYKTASEAKRRKKEIEYKEEVGTFTVPKCKSLDDLLKEYVALYGKATWAMSTYSSNVGLIDHYISPIIGHMKLNEITTRVIEKYYQQLLKTKPVDPIIGKKKNEFLTPHTVRSIHKLLHSCFEQAVKWELMEKNPAINATVPKYKAKKREICKTWSCKGNLEVCGNGRRPRHGLVEGRRNDARQLPDALQDAQPRERKSVGKEAAMILIDCIKCYFKVLDRIWLLLLAFWIPVDILVVLFEPLTVVAGLKKGISLVSLVHSQ